MAGKQVGVRAAGPLRVEGTPPQDGVEIHHNPIFVHVPSDAIEDDVKDEGKVNHQVNHN